MNRPTTVEPRQNYCIWIRYHDGESGEIDLSHLAGRGVFILWNDPEFFKAVAITPDGGIAWSEEIELCPDALYLQLTRKPITEIMPGLRSPVENV